MTYTKKIALVAATFLIAGSAFAATGETSTGTTGPSSSASLEVKNAPKLVNKSSSGVTLEWEKVAAAANYIIKYSKKSVANSTDPNPQYDNETDPVTSTGTTINDLDADTEYFFSVVAVDKDNNESETYSDELKVKTDAVGGAAAAPVATASGETAKLALTEVIPVDNKTVELKFSSTLGSDPITIKITKISDSSDVLVSSVKVDPVDQSKAIASIGTVLDPSSAYTVTIISAKDSKGNNIVEGTSGIQEFKTLANLAISPEATLNSATGTGTTGTGASLTGATVNDTLATAQALPATGTKENLIVIAALLLSFGIVYGYRKRMAK